MDDSRVQSIAESFIAGWNSQDVERVAALYTDDVTYIDPNTRGAVKGGDAIRRYLKKLLGRWEMHWSLREAFPLVGNDGFAALWTATIRPPSGSEIVEMRGMDLIMMRGDLVERNEVYFDRSVLAPLMGIET